MGGFARGSDKSFFYFWNCSYTAFLNHEFECSISSCIDVYLYFFLKANTKFLKQMQSTAFYSNHCSFLHTPFSLFTMMPGQLGERCQYKRGFTHRRRGAKQLCISEFIGYTLALPFWEMGRDMCSLLCYDLQNVNSPLHASRFHSTLKCKLILR